MIVLLGGVAPCAAAADPDPVLECLSRQSQSWEGRLTVHMADGSVVAHPVAYELRASTESGGFEGTMTVGTAEALDVTFGGSLGEGLRGSIGRADELVGRAPVGVDGKPDRGAISWTGGGAAFVMRLDREAMNLTIDGRLPLPAGLADDATWMTARLRRRAFRLTLGPFEINLWECLGIFATLFFASRFLIQWAASERAGRSVVPEMFWWVSLGGALLMIAYAVHFARFAVLLGQLTGWCVYLRNIYLIQREKRRARVA